jgi:cation-transporting P-type ATPase 13A2
MTIEEVLHPFFLFQIYSVCIWLYEEYYYFSAVIIFLSLYGAIYNIVITRMNIAKMREMAYYKSKVTIYKPYNPESNNSFD